MEPTTLMPGLTISWGSATFGEAYLNGRYIGIIFRNASTGEYPWSASRFDGATGTHQTSRMAANWLALPLTQKAADEAGD